MSDDSNLQSAVLAALSRQSSVVAAHVGVTAKSGVVTLTGHVDSLARRRAAREAVSRVEGVKAVADELRVNFVFETELDDDDIAIAALERLSRDIAVSKEAVDVWSEDGWVTLTGEVGSQDQSEAAEHHIRALPGVVGVTNRITIKPQVSAFSLAGDSRHAVLGSRLFDAMTVDVAAESDIVVA